MSRCHLSGEAIYGCEEKSCCEEDRREACEEGCREEEEVISLPNSFVQRRRGSRPGGVSYFGASAPRACIQTTPRPHPQCEHTRARIGDAGLTVD